MQSSLEFLVSVINHNHINQLHLFWDSFECFLSSNKKCLNFFSFVRPMHCYQRLEIVYCFLIRNRTELNIFISRVISGHMGLMYIEIPDIL